MTNKLRLELTRDTTGIKRISAIELDPYDEKLKSLMKFYLTFLLHDVGVIELSKLNTVFNKMFTQRFYDEIGYDPSLADGIVLDEDEIEDEDDLGDIITKQIDKKNVEEFVKQINEDSTFAEKVFEVFLEWVDNE